VRAQVPHHEFVVIGAGVAGIYQLYRLLQLDADVLVLETHPDLGGTWYQNRYPGCRFDSESYTYGYSFSPELLQEWDWSEHFAAQPETLRYLNYVVDKFDLRKHMQFDSKVETATFDDARNRWHLVLEDGREYTCHFLITAIGLISAPTLPRIPGMEDFAGPSFHTYDWPHEPLDLAGRRVGVIGTGATAVQLIGAIAADVEELYVFQRRPNWCAPLHNRTISPEAMAELKASYDEIFETCARTPGGFLHGPDRRKFAEVPAEERRAFWEQLYASPGFAIWLGNFREVLMDEEANAEFSAFVADKIRARVDDPEVAELLIPKDHGFGVQRVPMETNYYEAYNLDHVHLVDLQAAPIERITPTGVRTAERDYEVDVLVYATGFDAITGAFDRIDFVGPTGQHLRDKWRDGPSTYLGVQTAGFPNLIMIAGPQGASVSTNFPRAIEYAVDWATALIEHMAERGLDRVEAAPDAEAEWTEHVKELYGMLLLRNAKSWFTGYNSNVEGHDIKRYLIYNGGAPRYRKYLDEIAAEGYRGFRFA
jgi:cation diffusion facilitator CzcD-associated flavoprotein CzcO